MRTILLYTTLGCHLCEQAEALLLPLLREGVLEMQPCEIADNELLMAKYGIKIPVLKMMDGDEELCWPFDQAMTRAFLQRQGLQV